jgi:hypothetical protein
MQQILVISSLTRMPGSWNQAPQTLVIQWDYISKPLFFNVGNMILEKLNSLTTREEANNTESRQILKPRSIS